MQHFSSYDQSSDRQRFLTYLRQQQFMLQNECNGFFPGSSMMPMGGMGMMMMPMGMPSMMPHPYLQQQQQQRLMMMQQQRHSQNASGPVGMYSEATAESRRMILKSSSATDMNTNMGMGYPDVIKSTTTRDVEKQNARTCAAEMSRCVSPGSSFNMSNNSDNDSDSDCESEAGPTLMMNVPHVPEKKALMMKAQSETKKCEDKLKRKAGVKRSCSEISATKDKDTTPVAPSTGRDAVSEPTSTTSNFIPEIDQPKRRRSAYNLFFQHERARLLILAEKGEDVEYHPPRNLTVEEVRDLLENNPYFTDRSKRRHRKSHGKVTFMGLVKTVSNSWKNVDKQTKASFEALAREDQARYRKEWKEYKLKCRKFKRDALQKQKKNDQVQEEKSAKRNKVSHGMFKEESKQETKANVLRKALSVAETGVSLEAKSKKAASRCDVSMPQHDEIMHMLSSKIAEHETHDHDDNQLVDLALELDSEFAMGIDGIAMV